MLMPGNTQSAGRKAAIDKTVSKVGLFARVSDGVFCAISMALAYRAENAGSHAWAIGWGLCGAFCLYTAVTGPVDKIWALANRKLLGRQAAKMAADVQVDAPVVAGPMNRQQRREQARRLDKR